MLWRAGLCRLIEGEPGVAAFQRALHQFADEAAGLCGNCLPANDKNKALHRFSGGS